MGLLSTKENKDDLFSKILIYFDISITHPLQTAYKKYYASNGFGKVGSFFPGISVSITIIYFAHINRPKQPGILVLSFLSTNVISPNKIYIYL